MSNNGNSRDFYRIAEFCESNFDLNDNSLSEVYFYQSLSLCVIDAIFSIGVNYKSTLNVIENYCTYFDLKRIRSKKSELPPNSEQESIKEFLEKVTHHGIDKFTEQIFDNRQRTSTINGILKTEAVHQFVKVLLNFNINYFQDVPKILNNKEFEQEIKKIKGQNSGVSLRYFYMLVGEDTVIKPDRMILRFLIDGLHRKVKIEEAQVVLEGACNILKEKYHKLTPRLLDLKIWTYQREQNKK